MGLLSTSGDGSDGDVFGLLLSNGGVLPVKDAPATASGGVSAVTGTAPITSSGGATPAIGITPASDVAAGSLSAADKTKLDAITDTNLWTWDAPIPAAAAPPELAQTQAVAGAGKTLTIRTQAAAAGSGLLGGSMDLVLGKDDAAAVNKSFFFGFEEVVAGATFEMARLVAVGTGTQTTILTLGGGTDEAGANGGSTEVAALGTLNIATEAATGFGPNAQIAILPTQGFVGGFGGHSFFGFQQNAADGTPILILSSGPSDPAPASGVLRFAFDTAGSAGYPLLVMRNSGNTADLPMVQRVFGELYFGDYAESNRYHAKSSVLFEILDGLGDGFVFTTTGGKPFQVHTDLNKTVAFAAAGIPFGIAASTDGVLSQQIKPELDTTSTAANQVIGIITPTDNATTTVTVKLIARSPTAPDWLSQELVATYNKVAGVLTASGDGPFLTSRGKSATPTYAGVNLNLAISGGALNVQVTPWTANTTHWSMRVELEQNTGAF
jgi:hypothetical protein